MLNLLLALAAAAVTFSRFVDSRLPIRQALAARQGAASPHINGSFTNATCVSLAVSTQTGKRNATAPLLYGWMFEDINVWICPPVLLASESCLNDSFLA